MTGSRLLAFALCVMLFACPPPSRDAGAAAPEPQRPDEVAAEVVAAFTAFAEAIDAKDWATAGTFYAESPSFRWWEDGQLRYPNAGTARAALEGLAAYGPLTVRYGAPDVIALGPDAATLSVTFQTTVGQGARAFSFAGVQTLLLRRGESGWAVLRGHTSTRRPSNDQAGAAAAERVDAPEAAPVDEGASAGDHAPPAE